MKMTKRVAHFVNVSWGGTAVHLAETQKRTGPLPTLPRNRCQDMRRAKTI